MKSGDLNASQQERRLAFCSILALGCAAPAAPPAVAKKSFFGGISAIVC
jgi:hypothetical protein